MGNKEKNKAIFFKGNLSVATFSKYWGHSDGKITEVEAIFKMALRATFQWIGRNCSRFLISKIQESDVHLEMTNGRIRNLQICYK